MNLHKPNPQSCLYYPFRLTQVQVLPLSSLVIADCYHKSAPYQLYLCKCQSPKLLENLSTFSPNYKKLRVCRYARKLSNLYDMYGRDNPVPLPLLYGYTSHFLLRENHFKYQLFQDEFAMFLY